MNKIEITHGEDSIQLELNLSEETKQNLLGIKQEKVGISIKGEDVIIRIEATKEYFNKILEDG